MTTYYLHLDNSVEKFKEICGAIERLYPDYTKHELLVDVDYSLIQIYTKDSNEIIIDNSAELELIVARTDIDLSDFEYTIAISKNGKLIYK